MRKFALLSVAAVGASVVGGVMYSILVDRKFYKTLDMINARITECKDEAKSEVKESLRKTS